MSASISSTLNACQQLPNVGGWWFYFYGFPVRDFGARPV
jgi:hypothetical protein